MDLSATAKYQIKNNHQKMVIFTFKYQFDVFDVSASSWFQEGDSVSVYEALSLMIAFGTLIAVIVLSR